MNQSPTQFPISQRTSYQFPVYRWIGWLSVAGFAIGLTMMFFVAGMFGIPAPLGWASMVIMFTVGALLLDRPKLLLNVMLFYFLLLPSNRLFGLFGLPLPGFIDELFFLPLIAVIVMNWIQRRQLQQATIFPVVFCVLAALSWYVNRPPIFTTVQVTLIMLKSYIIWYYCRLTCTFENEGQLSRWVWVYILYSALQYPYNILWQRGLWPSFHPDRSGGVFGPDSTGSAHIVGYLNIYALLLLAGWWASVGRHVRARTHWMALLLVVVIAYNLIFMTDTKHGLILFPFAALPFLFHPKFPVRLRMHLLTGGLVFALLAGLYFRISGDDIDLHRIRVTLQQSPKGDLLHAVTTDFHHLVPYPLLGAGPGRFASNQGVAARAPLARRYIIPHHDQQRRMGYFRASGTLLASSVLGAPQADLLVLMGEFGWLGTAAFYLFLGWVIVKLWKKSAALPLERVASGYFMALSCCVIFLVFTTLIMNTFTVGVLSFPLWMLIGRMWDMKLESPQPDSDPEAG
jgi:hypothetical protein